MVPLATRFRMWLPEGRPARRLRFAQWLLGRRRGRFPGEAARALVAPLGFGSRSHGLGQGRFVQAAQRLSDHGG
ncbi:hypothetical protein SLA2020_348270 [Shorea laevis]